MDVHPPKNAIYRYWSLIHSHMVDIGLSEDAGSAPIYIYWYKHIYILYTHIQDIATLIGKILIKYCLWRLPYTQWWRDASNLCVCAPWISFKSQCGTKLPPIFSTPSSPIWLYNWTPSSGSVDMVEDQKASSLLRELPRKLELPISLNISQPFRRHRWPWPWHREPCPALSYHSQRRSLWCPTPSWPLSLRWSKRRCSCRLSCQQHAASWSQPCYACSSTSLSVWNLLQSSLCCPWRPRPLPTFLEQSCSLPSSSSLELSSRWSSSLPSCSSSRTSSWEGPCWLKREGIDEIEGGTSCKRAGAPKSRNMRDQSAFTSWYTMPVCFTSFSQHVARRVARCCTTCRISTYHLTSCLSRNKTSLICEFTNFLLKTCRLLCFILSELAGYPLKVILETSQQNVLLEWQSYR